MKGLILATLLTTSFFAPIEARCQDELKRMTFEDWQKKQSTAHPEPELYCLRHGP